MIVTPETSLWKWAFWIRVLTTSSGAATVMEATAPAMDATKSDLVQRGSGGTEDEDGDECS
jgi:F0F1-type ATP synthase epsilon subunit